jgi:hypothetical protein
MAASDSDARLDKKNPLVFLSTRASDSDAELDKNGMGYPFAAARISSQARRTWRSAVWV